MIYLADNYQAAPLNKWVHTAFLCFNFKLSTLPNDVKEMVDVVEIVPAKPAIGKAFKKEGKTVMDYLAQMDKDSKKVVVWESVM